MLRRDVIDVACCIQIPLGLGWDLGSQVQVAGSRWVDQRLAERVLGLDLHVLGRSNFGLDGLCLFLLP